MSQISASLFFPFHLHHIFHHFSISTILFLCLNINTQCFKTSILNGNKKKVGNYFYRPNYYQHQLFFLFFIFFCLLFVLNFILFIIILIIFIIIFIPIIITFTTSRLSTTTIITTKTNIIEISGRLDRPQDLKIEQGCAQIKSTNCIRCINSHVALIFSIVFIVIFVFLLFSLFSLLIFMQLFEGVFFVVSITVVLIFIIYY